MWAVHPWEISYSIPLKYAHGSDVLCFFMVTPSVREDSRYGFTHILQSYFSYTRIILQDQSNHCSGASDVTLKEMGTTEHYLTQHTQDDVIKWKHLQCYWPFVRGIQRPPMDSPHKGPVTRSFDVFFDLHLNKRLSITGVSIFIETPVIWGTIALIMTSL